MLLEGIVFPILRGKPPFQRSERYSVFAQKKQLLIMFEFGHKHWGKQVTAFWDEQREYFAVGSAKEITKILKRELKEIEEEEDDEEK